MMAQKVDPVGTCEETCIETLASRLPVLELEHEWYSKSRRAGVGQQRGQRRTGAGLRTPKGDASRMNFAR